jgi:transposase InsO family protein
LTTAGRLPGRLRPAACSTRRRSIALGLERHNGVVQNRVTVETRNPFVGAALSIFSVTRNQHFLNHALAWHGQPEISNPDQGSQFTGAAFTGLLLQNRIAISMDGRGAWRDHVFVERLWRSVKYQEVYLRAYDSVAEARASIGRYLAFYHCKRPHSSLDARTPDQAYFDGLPLAAAA